MTRAFEAVITYYGGPLDGLPDQAARIPVPEWLPGGGDLRYLCVGHDDQARLRYEWQPPRTGLRNPCSYHPQCAPPGCPNRPKADAT